MTTKDSNLIASLFNEHLRQIRRETIKESVGKYHLKLIINFATELGRRNFSFDREKFLRACLREEYITPN